MFIVNYHNVVADALDALDRRSLRLPVSEFQDEMRRLKTHFHPMSVESLLERAVRGDVDPLAVAITFDDGCLGVARHAWPIMRELGLTATVFVITETLTADPRELRRDDELEMAFRLTEVPALRLSSFGYPDLPLGTPDERMTAMKAVKGVLKRLGDAQRQRSHVALLERLEVTREACRSGARDEKFRTMTADDVSRLKDDGWTVGSHTRTHRSLSALKESDVRSELAGSRDDLMRLLHLDATLLAYPYGGPGHVGPVAPRLAGDCGYRFAMTAEPGAVTPGVDRFLVPRVSFQDLPTAAGT